MPVAPTPPPERACPLPTERFAAYQHLVFEKNRTQENSHLRKEDWRKPLSAPTAGREASNIIRRSASSVNVQLIAGDLINSPNELFLTRQV
jgi:hypothetical protein